MSILNDSFLSPKQDKQQLPTNRSYKSTTREWLQHMTTPPFTADKADDLQHLFVDMFEMLNDDISPLLQKLTDLKSPDRYQLNTQIEQVAFKDLG